MWPRNHHRLNATLARNNSKPAASPPKGVTKAPSAYLANAVRWQDEDARALLVIACDLAMAPK